MVEKHLLAQGLNIGPWVLSNIHLMHISLSHVIGYYNCQLPPVSLKMTA